MFGELMLAFSFGVFIGALSFWIVAGVVRQSYRKLSSRLLPALFGIILAILIGCVFFVVSRRTGHLIVF
jgi:hypothetical protein